MNVQVSLHELAEAFGRTYGSLDIRTAALKQGDQWINVLTVVRVSYESPESVRETHRNLKSLHVSPEVEDFRVLLSARPFSEWPNLCSELKKHGCVAHDEGSVALAQPLDILGKTGYVRRHNNIFRETPGSDWPTCEASFEHGTTDAANSEFNKRLSLLNSPKLTQRISQFGHSSAWDAIDAFMAFSNSYIQIPHVEFHVSLPVFGAIDKIEVLPTERILSAQARLHAEFPDFQLFAVYKDSPSNTGLRPKATLPLSIRDAQEGTTDGIRRVVASAVLPSHVEPDDYVEVKAVSILGDIDSHTRQIRELQPAAHVHPFYHALTAFRPVTDLHQALAYPQAKQVPKRQPWNIQDYFERDVCWMLACFGFASVTLAEYEALRAAGSKFQRGSLDILAFHPMRNVLLLGACTLNAPRDEDFGNLMTLRSILLQEVFVESEVCIIPAVFTGVPAFPSYWPPSSGEHRFLNAGIPVFDASRLQSALRLIPAKREQDFFDFLSNSLQYAF